ncbi:hypothetical protein BJY01DRAFT_65957 [Aspergillus pseudoustus]|uniref:Fe2OG dioxygenase domain-containing protein n=1 Tax=Aspergillus pseudoustus TaxID=1810923 RepID=A0ABR4J6Z4_9EURO
MWLFRTIRNLTRMADKQSSPFELPGFNLPLDHKPKRTYGDVVYANALDLNDIEDGYCGYTFTVRELLMMQIMESVTDKPDWETKVFNEEITNKWREEIAQSGRDVTPKMIDYIMAELKWKAEVYKNTGIVMAYDPGVVKSDTIIPKELQQQLIDTVKPLEDVSEEEKDYHPRSDNKVVDLVHPSLFPLIYGRTRVLPDKLITVDDCFLSVGQGEVTKVQEEVAVGYEYSRRRGHSAYSTKFQWLPCNVNFTGDGECKIVSYINNLHPAKHRDLYGVIEQIMARAVGLWGISLLRPGDIPRRIQYEDTDYETNGDDPEPEQESDQDEDEYWDRHQEWRERRQPKQPEPGVFWPPWEPRFESLNLEKKFRNQGLQVIVKLANIELTPEKPLYEGGSWHIEGQLNERICATAIYYYDSENITSNSLSFRHRADTEYFQEVSYEQGEFQFLRVFGFDSDAGSDSSGSQITQDLGGVDTRAGRLLTFPNTLQHRVSPFSLADPTKPGHRKILALFLIDPSRRVISTANVPPQREDWCSEWRQATRDVLVPRLPVELQQMVHRDVDFEPMTMEEAKKYRLELMDERTANVEHENETFQDGGFSLCEH